MRQDTFSVSKLPRTVYDRMCGLSVHNFNVTITDWKRFEGDLHLFIRKSQEGKRMWRGFVRVHKWARCSRVPVVVVAEEKRNAVHFFIFQCDAKAAELVGQLTALEVMNR